MLRNIVATLARVFAPISKKNRLGSQGPQ